MAGKFPWPKSMRWASSPFQWVRAASRWALCLLDGKFVPLEIAGIEAGAETRGHRFLGPGPFKVKNFSDYEAKLAAHHVMLDPAARADAISEQAHAPPSKRSSNSSRTKRCSSKTPGSPNGRSCRWARSTSSFLEVPGEVLMTSMKTHQKCFSLRVPKTKKLANKFLLVANLVAKDGGAQIVAGNEKVTAARLSDAKFFWDQDLKHPLGEMAGKLSGTTFHEKLGTQKDRVERIAELAYELAGACDADPQDARRAAALSKADLVQAWSASFLSCKA